MKKPILVGFFIVAVSSSAWAQDKIQAFVNTKGKTVFTNLDSNTPVQSYPSSGLTLHRKEMPESIRSLIEGISANHGLDPNLVSAVIKAESNFNRWAVSRKGARGLMQLIPATAARFGVQDSFDPQQNIEGGVRYLKFLLEKFDGNIELALASYNAGENLVEKLGRVPSITETRNYVHKISTTYRAHVNATTAKASDTPAASVAESAAVVQPTPEQIYRTVDQRGVIHFSNIGPVN